MIEPSLSSNNNTDTLTKPATKDDYPRDHDVPPNPQTPQDLLEHIPIGHPDSMMSKESVRRAIELFHTLPNDVIVATFPKTGTTLMCWICHLLRTGAYDDASASAPPPSSGEGRTFPSIKGFETLYEIVPWPMLSWDIGIDPNVHGSEFTPRVFKSHLRMASIYSGCKYVVTVRDVGKTALSFYNFFLSKRVPFLVDANYNHDENGSDTEDKLLMDLSTFLVDTPFVRGCPQTTSTSDLRASIWEYYVEYHALMECPSVLMLVYEDFIGDEEVRKDNIRRLGNFMGVFDDDGDGGNNNNNNNADNNEQLIDRTASMSTKPYMANHMSKFDEPYERAKNLNRAADISQLAPGAKVALKTHTQTYNDRAVHFLEEQWRESMGVLGYEDYDSFCVAIRKRNEKLFG